MKLFEKKRINPQWILHGEGAKYIAPADAEQGKPRVVCIVEVRPPKECSAQELFNELVRRAMQESNIKGMQKQAAATWLSAKKLGDEW